MAIPKTILALTDFGPSSEAALDYAVELAKAVGAEVAVLHAFAIPVVTFPEGAVMSTIELTDRIVEAVREGMDRAVVAHDKRGVTIRPITRQGDPWRTALAVVDEIGAGLIVVGTHGRSGLPRALLGSVAEKIVRTSPVPVLTIHESHVRGR